MAPPHHRQHSQQRHSDPLEDTLSFGAWLRQRRRALDWTQAELAQRVGCARITIRRIEADELKPSQQLAELFAEHLGVPPTQQKRWLQFARGLAPMPQSHPIDLPATPLGLPTNLPAPITTFLGRDHESIDGCRLVTTSRLLTLTGVGGAGKTRLALEMARALVNQWQPADTNSSFPDGIWWVELAPLTDAALIPETVAKALGLREQPGQSMDRLLVETLKTKQMLLLLDNCEHLVAGCATWVHQWLHHCPHLHILATSREPLQLMGEQRFPVAPLAVAAASELFVQRARLVDPAFTRTVANGAAIDQLCQQVDYLPLAIELLAARSDLFTPQVMLERLQARPLDLLSAELRNLPARQRTLRHTIQHSYDLLMEREQALFRTLGVFVGGFDLAAVIHFGFEEATFQALINKSLVQVAARHSSEDGERRFVLLETLREYASERLVAMNHVANTRTCHAKYFLNLAVIAEQHMAGSEKTIWRDCLQRNYDNLRTALDWFMVIDLQAAQRMTSLLHPFWLAHGLFTEGRYWLSKVLTVTTLPTSSRAWALQAAADLAQRQGDYISAKQLANESLALFEAIGNLAGCVASLRVLGWTLAEMQTLPQALSYFEQSLSLAHQTEQQQLVANALTNIAEILIRQEVAGKTVQNHLQESTTIYQKLGQLEGLAHVLHVKAVAQMYNGNYAQAKVLWQEALTIRQQLGDKWEVAWTRYYLGKASWLVGDRRLAIGCWEEVYNYFSNIASSLGIMYVCYEFGQIERCWCKNFDQAVTYYQKSIKLAQEMKHSLMLGRCFAGLGGVALAGSQPNCAAHLLGKAQEIADTLTGPLFKLSDYREEYATLVDEARIQLGQIAFTAAWIKGQAMTLDEAVAYALTVQYHGNLEKTLY